jgi:tol-pal system protein YbgF
MNPTPSRLSKAASLAIVALLVASPQANAVSKEMIQLQAQVQALQDSLQQMQRANAESMGVLQHLVEQTADSVNKMSVTVDSLSQTVKTQNEATAAKVEGVSGQVQTLNDSVDELKARIATLNKAMQDLQAQAQTMAAQQPAQQGAPGQPGQPQPTAAQASSAPQAPPVGDLYQGALRDYNSARYDVAGSEFSDVLRYYPQDDLAGNAQFYLGEIAYRQGNYQAAIKAYDTTVEQFSGNPKIPAAQLRKGEALIALNQKDAGVRELRSLIQRYPQTPEAQQARSRLNALGVRITPPAKPTAGRQ